MKINTTALSVMQDEVPRAVPGPGIDPIDALVGEAGQQGLGGSCVHPDVKISMSPSLLADQRVDGPTSADAYRCSVRFDGSDQGAHGLRRHVVGGHATRVSG